jgi:hypothetical protein
MAFLQLLVNVYVSSGTPVKIAEGFLAVFTTGFTTPKIEQTWPVTAAMQANTAEYQEKCSMSQSMMSALRLQLPL